jgi:Ca2+:H+ antiporter
VARALLYASFALTPLVLVLRYAVRAGDVAIFLVAAAALVPLAWLIGNATEQVAEHTGPGIGGFLNASLGNAPELIIALFAISDGLPEVVRGSLTGSIIGNILLVLGFALAAAPERPLDRASLVPQLGLVGLAVVLFLVPAVPGFHGDPDRHSLALLTLPVAIVLLLVYGAVTAHGLRRHHRLHEESDAEPHAGAWPLPLAVVTLAVATAATAIVSELLVHTLDGFGHAAGLSEFFVAAVIVAIVGNAAEHGGAVVLAHRGKVRLATEIAISSSAQVALLVTPAVALLSWAVTPSLPLSFRPIELAAMGGGAVVVGLVVAGGRSRKWQGVVLVALYAGVAAGFGVAGNR